MSELCDYSNDFSDDELMKKLFGKASSGCYFLYLVFTFYLANSWLQLPIFSRLLITLYFCSTFIAFPIHDITVC